MPWPRATLQVQAEGVNEPRKCRAPWLVMTMTTVFLTSGRQLHKALPAPLLAGLTPKGFEEMQRQRRHCHTSLQSQNPDKESGPSPEVILPHPPSPEPWPCVKPTQHQRAFLALRGSSPSQPPFSQASLPDARPSQRGVAHLAWTALAGGLGPGMGKAVCWFLPAP